MVNKLSLGEQLAQVPTVRKGPRCGVGMLLERLDPDDREALITAMNDEMASAPFISRILVDNGYRITTNQIARHRRRECQCP